MHTALTPDQVNSCVVATCQASNLQMLQKNRDGFDHEEAYTTARHCKGYGMQEDVAAASWQPSNFMAINKKEHYPMICQMKW